MGYTIVLDGSDHWLMREADEIGSGETLDLRNPVYQPWEDTMVPLFDKANGFGMAGHPSEVFRWNAHPKPDWAQMTFRSGLLTGFDSI